MRLRCAMIAGCVLALLPAPAWGAQTLTVSDRDQPRGPKAAVSRSGLSVVAWTEVQERGALDLPERSRVRMAISRDGRRFSRAVAVTERGAALTDVRAAPDGSVALLYALTRDQQATCAPHCARPVRMRVVSPRGRLARAESAGGVRAFVSDAFTDVGRSPALGIGRDGDFEVAFQDARRRPAIVRRLGPRRFTRPHRLGGGRAESLQFAANDRGAAIFGWIRGDSSPQGKAEWRTRPARGRWGPVRTIGRSGFMVEPAVAVGANGHTAFRTRFGLWPPSLPGFIARGTPEGRLAGVGRLDGSVGVSLAVDPAGDVVAKWQQDHVFEDGTVASQTLISVLGPNGWSARQRIGGSGTDFPIAFDGRGHGYGLAGSFEHPPTLWSRAPGASFRPLRQLAPRGGYRVDVDANARGALVATWMERQPDAARIVATALPAR